jgi:hypothetical protein
VNPQLVRSPCLRREHKHGNRPVGRLSEQQARGGRALVDGAVPRWIRGRQRSPDQGNVAPVVRSSLLQVGSFALAAVTDCEQHRAAHA